MALALLCLVSGCTDGQETSENKKQETMVENGDVQSETEKTLPKMEEQEEKIETSETAMAEMNGENTAIPQLLNFVDINKKEYQAEMNVNVEKHPYIYNRRVSVKRREDDLCGRCQLFLSIGRGCIPLSGEY